MKPLKHMKAKELAKGKIARRKMSFKRKQKMRNKKNAKAPTANMSWSTKTRSYVKKDPKVRRMMKLVAKFRRKRSK